MSDISAKLVMDLRAKTGAGMMDCKRALMETKGDFDLAVDWLRKKGISAAAKKSSRIAAEGLVGLFIKEDLKKACLVELNSETDFVARNDNFQKLLLNIGKLALENTDEVEKLKAVKYTLNNRNLEEEIRENVALIGENLNLRRVKNVEVKEEGIVAGYVHNEIATNMGKIGVMVVLASKGDKDKLQTLGKQIAMHIAASKPESLTISDLDPELVEREKTIFLEQSRASGKPESIVEKMVEGRLRKFYEEVVLLEQVFVMDGKTKILEVLNDFSKELGTEVKLESFVRFSLGEGIEKNEGNFADEVASVISSSKS